MTAAATTAYQRVAAALVAHGAQPPRTANGPWRCPAHDDHTPSLSVTTGPDRVLLKCQAGCPTEGVVEALGLSMGDLFDEERAKPDRPRIVATYSYVAEDGQLLYEVVRFDPKGFRQRRPDGKGGWIWNLQGVERVPYRLPEVIEAVDEGRRVFITEGEKDADALRRAGEAATCNAGGAGKWDPRWARYFIGAGVVIVADQDVPGYRHAQQVRDTLTPVAASVIVVQALTGKDAADHLGAGRTVAEFEQIGDELDDLAGVEPAPTAIGVPMVHGVGAIDEAVDDPDVGLRARIELAATRARSGGVILAAPTVPEAVWGAGHQVLHAAGEPTLLCGPDGVGKTTLAQQFVLRRCGVIDDPLLGFPVAPGNGRTLYLACDRPSQALRSFRRMVTEADQEVLDERLVIWYGPLPFDLASEPKALLILAQTYGADTVVIDSVKDVVADLTKDAAGQQFNTAMQHCVSAGVELLGLHHQRKAQAGAGKPRHLADVYGSRWITAGCGSVLMLWGETGGDLVVELDHLKQPDETVGPLRIVHDHTAGVTSVENAADAWSVAKGALKGVTAPGCAIAMYGTAEPTRNQIERARRQLNRLVAEGRLHKQPGTKGGPGGGDAAIYYPITTTREAS